MTSDYTSRWIASFRSHGERDLTIAELRILRTTILASRRKLFFWLLFPFALAGLSAFFAAGYAGKAHSELISALTGIGCFLSVAPAILSVRDHGSIARDLRLDLARGSIEHFERSEDSHFDGFEGDARDHDRPRARLLPRSIALFDTGHEHGHKAEALGQGRGDVCGHS